MGVKEKKCRIAVCGSGQVWNETQKISLHRRVRENVSVLKAIFNVLTKWTYLSPF